MQISLVIKLLVMLSCGAAAQEKNDEVQAAHELLDQVPSVQQTAQFQVLASGRRRSRRKTLVERIAERLEPTVPKEEHPLLVRAREKLELAAQQDHPEALYMLGEMHFAGAYGSRRNFTAAVDFYERLMRATGNSTAYRRLGLMYATGLGGTKDTAKAMLYWNFGATAGDTASEMILGYRHLYGISAVKSCQDSAYYYQLIARKAIEEYEGGPPGGKTLPEASERLSDEYGGVYGYADSDENLLDDVLEYFRYTSERGDYNSLLVLGQVYHTGALEFQRDINKAMEYYLQVATKVFSSDGSKKLTDDEFKALDIRLKTAAAKAAAHLGRIYWRGEQVEKNNNLAYKWFKRAVENGVAEGFNGLGEMFLSDALGVPNKTKARHYFTLAADGGQRDAQANIGLMHYNEGSYTNAFKYFSMAANNNHVAGHYYLAEMYISGLGVDYSCPQALSHYKSVSEMADWSHSPIADAYRAYLARDYETAQLHYLLAAEMGYEVAQANLAWLMEKGSSHLVTLEGDLLGLDNESALKYWIRAGNQGNSEARIKTGDYYYSHAEVEKAAQCYEAAAVYEKCTLGMWNLGWMYENGVGVPKDYHMAMRWYDNAMFADSATYLPVTLSKLKLQLRVLWSWLTFSYDGNPLHPQYKYEEHSTKEKTNPEDDDWNIGQNGENIKKWKLQDTDLPEEEEEEELDLLYESVLLALLCVVAGWMVYVRNH